MGLIIKRSVFDAVKDIGVNIQDDGWRGIDITIITGTELCCVKWESVEI